MEIKVMIVDDQPFAREGLKRILRTHKDIKVISTAINGKDALEKLTDEQPDIILMDYKMPVMYGDECTKLVKQRYPAVKVLMLTTFDDEECIIDALKAGAEGYVLKDLALEELIAAIKNVYSGRVALQPEVTAKLISHVTKDDEMRSTIVTSEEGKACCTELPEGLTQREKEVLSLVAKGLGNEEIAKTLYISEGTVRNYISSLYDKLGVNKRSKLIVYARENR